MVRDLYKDKSYFDGFLDNHDKRIMKFEKAAESLIQERGVDGEGVYTLVTYLEVLYFNKLIALYSLDRPLDDVRDFLPEVVNIMERSYTPSVIQNYDYYIECLWLLSIGNMLDINTELFDRIKKLATVYKEHDLLIDFLLNGTAIEEQGSGTTSFLVDRPYVHLIDVITSSDKKTAIDRLEKYLKTDWYPAHEGTGWHDTHTIDDYVYRGYWSFESGAIVKILGLDDSILKDVPYYPYDMVHYKG